MFWELTTVAQNITFAQARLLKAPIVGIAYLLILYMTSVMDKFTVTFGHRITYLVIHVWEPTAIYRWNMTAQVSKVG